MNISIRFHKQWYLTLLLVIVFTGCVKKEFEAPEIKEPSELPPPTLSIAELLAMHTTGDNGITAIGEEIIVGQVISSDQFGNIYKEVHIQDNSGGVLLRIDESALYNRYKIGTEIAVDLSNLVIGSYGSNFQIGIQAIYNGGPSAGQIPAPLSTQYISVGELKDTVETLTLTIKDINDAFNSGDYTWVGRKILIKDAKVASADQGKTYADAVNERTENRTFTDGTGNIILRNSGYSDFAAEKLPQGIGSMWVTLSRFRDTPQLYINSPADLKFNDNGGQPGGDIGFTPPLVSSVNESFDGTKYDDINTEGWNNIIEQGSSKWFFNEYQGNSYPNLSVYKAGEARKAWLISPLLNVDDASDKTISFKSREEYRTGAILKVMVSSDFDGKDIPSDSKYSWTEINPTIGSGGSSGYGPWTESGSFDLSAYGNVVVAFYYEGEEGVKDGGFSIDDFKFNSGGNNGGSTNYYQSAEGLSGFALKSELSSIVANGAQTLSYADLWDAYVSTDDKYGKGEKIWDMYSDIPDPNNPNVPDAVQPNEYEYVIIADQCGNYSSEGDCYNREHSFPKSWFNDAAPMYTDLHQVVPTDGKVNGQRSNHPFAEVNASWTSVNGSKLGSSTTSGYSGTAFEPIDEYKGDFARIYFYMATRYENEISSWEKITTNSDVVLNGTSDVVFESWQLELLKKWHNNDPVSQKELDRNEAVYLVQKNRNPFVDHPEYVTSIWGN